MSEKQKRPDVTEIFSMDSPYFRWRRRKGLIMIILVALASIGIVILTRYSNPNLEQRYKTEQASIGGFTVIVTATGTLQPTNTVSVGSELSGIIKSVEVSYNDRVKVGQVLARLDTSKLEAQLAQAKANLESAQAKVLQAQATVKETQAKLSQLRQLRSLSDGKVPSQIEMDAAEAAYERAQADLASARAAVSQAKASIQAIETDLSKSIIRSPINGVVLNRKVEPGQTVAASLQAPELFVLAEDLTKMDLHVNVDEADVSKVKDGQEATFTVDAHPQRVFKATVKQVRYASTTVSGVVTYEAILDVNNRDLALRPGMTATARISVQEISNALVIPTAALRFSPPTVQTKPLTSSGGGLVGKLLPRFPGSRAGGGSPIRTLTPETVLPKEQQVWVLQDGKLTALTITTGATNGVLTEVTGGELKPGMDVVVDVIYSSKKR
ncbi:MAG: efflux RND transporter periplasmic adaptor subunit [Syntrophobacterales bacterium]|nr:efflux RND transporter periplasmic adaptor subunit [Syntrophobacterales bacterium]